MDECEFAMMMTGVPILAQCVYIVCCLVYPSFKGVVFKTKPASRYTRIA